MYIFYFSNFIINNYFKNSLYIIYWTEQNRTRPNQTGSNWTELEWTKSNRTKPNWTGPNRTKSDRTKPNQTEPNKIKSNRTELLFNCVEF